jgi:hypothetical protein
MRPIKEITSKQENFRIEQKKGSPFRVARVDFIEPEPVGTIILMAFRITGYDRDCDGSAMVRAEHINKDGDCSGWDIDSIGLNSDSELVVGSEELPSLFKDTKNPYTVDSTHTDPAEKETALALKYRQRAREAEGLLAVAEKALEVYRDRDKQLEDILGKPETFLPECSDRKTKGSVSKCDNPYNFRFTGPCSKRCANPTKPLNKGESK